MSNAIKLNKETVSGAGNFAFFARCGMKIAVSGKGGVGKTTIVAGLALSFKNEGKKVIVIDADPDMNLAATLGFPNPEKIIPLVEMKELIAERTGVEDLEEIPAGYFKLNPRVEDIPEKYALEHLGLKLMVMGTVKKAAAGCVCPENAFLRALLNHLVLNREEVVIVDLVAGIEPFGRATAQAVDALLVVAEPNARALETAGKIKKLAEEMKIKKLFLLGNKVRNEEDKEFIQKNSFSLDILGYISYNQNFLKAHKSLLEEKKFTEEIRICKKKLLSLLGEQG